MPDSTDGMLTTEPHSMGRFWSFDSMSITGSPSHIVSHIRFTAVLQEKEMPQLPFCRCLNPAAETEGLTYVGLAVEGGGTRPDPPDRHTWGSHFFT